MLVTCMCPSCGAKLNVEQEDLGNDKLRVTSECSGCNRKYVFEGDPRNIEEGESKVETIDEELEEERNREKLTTTKESENQLTKEVLGDWKKYFSKVFCEKHQMPMILSSGIGRVSCPKCIIEANMVKKRQSLRTRWAKVVFYGISIAAIAYTVYSFMV